MRTGGGKLMTNESSPSPPPSRKTVACPHPQFRVRGGGGRGPKLWPWKCFPRSWDIRSPPPLRGSVRAALMGGAELLLGFHFPGNAVFRAKLVVGLCLQRKFGSVLMGIWCCPHGRRGGRPPPPVLRSSRVPLAARAGPFVLRNAEVARPLDEAMRIFQNAF